MQHLRYNKYYVINFIFLFFCCLRVNVLRIIHPNSLYGGLQRHLLHKGKSEAPFIKSFDTLSSYFLNGINYASRNTVVVGNSVHNS